VRKSRVKVAKHPGRMKGVWGPVNSFQSDKKWSGGTGRALPHVKGGGAIRSSSQLQNETSVRMMDCSEKNKKVLLTDRCNVRREKLFIGTSGESCPGSRKPEGKGEGIHSKAGVVSRLLPPVIKISNRSERGRKAYTQDSEKGKKPLSAADEAKRGGHERRQNPRL